MIGKAIRMERIMNRATKRTVIVPMDHGVSLGPIEGLSNMAETIDKIANGGADAVLLHKGIVRMGHRKYGKDIGLIVHLSASTSLGPDANDKQIVCSVEEALRLGADCVSIHVNVGAATEPRMLREMGEISGACAEWGIPLLAMMYPRGPGIKNAHDAQLVAHAARLGAELGADIVKTNYTGDVRSFSKVVEGAGVPVVIAGGPKMNTDEELLRMVHDSIRAGGAGASIGRNVFQAKNPTRMVKALAEIVHENGSVADALAVLKK